MPQGKVMNEGRKEMAYLKLLFDIKKELNFASEAIPKKTPLLHFQWLVNYVEQEILNIISNKKYMERNLDG